MKELIEQRAEEYRKQLGGKIFSFPINENDPLSKYAVTMHTENGYITYPEEVDISESASGILLMLEELKTLGLDADYDSNVRFISYEAQVNAPSVTMRRLKNSGDLKQHKPTGFLREGIDITPSDDSYNITARGLIKFSYLAMVEEKLPKALQFMNEYYKLLSMRRYGKTASAIKQEVRRMTKNEAITWIERTYKHYVHNDYEVVGIMDSLKAGN